MPTATAVGFEDVSTGFTALVQGKVEGFSTSEETYQKLVSRLGANSSKYAVVQPAIGREVWGLGVRKGEGAMLQSVNGALRDMEASGELQSIFDKWLGAESMYKMKRPFKVEPI
ncbi:Bacterial extracellular solute-binding protein [compost metagenome]